MGLMNKSEVTPVSEFQADKRRVCEIRFDCLVTMHDYGVRETEKELLRVNQSLPPQWFKTNSIITLEEIKYQSEELLGLRLKQMLFELEQTIEKYENL
jgi:hypothetical protein